jgi:hypothetical protein
MTITDLENGRITLRILDASEKRGCSAIQSLATPETIFERLRRIALHARDSSTTRRRVRERVQVPFQAVCRIPRARAPIIFVPTPGVAHLTEPGKWRTAAPSTWDRKGRHPRRRVCVVNPRSHKLHGSCRCAIEAVEAHRTQSRTRGISSKVFNSERQPFLAGLK